MAIYEDSKKLGTKPNNKITFIRQFFSAKKVKIAETSGH
jgi:hypothetical protein